jgi:hypothetical protein
MSDSVIDAASNIMEVKQQVVGETERLEKDVSETQGSQELIAVSENENNTAEEATSQARNSIESNAPDAGHTVPDSAEQTSNTAIVVVNEIEEIKHVVVQETVVTATMPKSVQQLPASSEKTDVDDQSSIDEGAKKYPDHVVTLVSTRNGQLPKDSTNVQNAVQVQDKGILQRKENNLEVCSHDQNVSGTNSNDQSGITEVDDGKSRCAGESETVALKSEKLELKEVLDKSNKVLEVMQMTGTGDVRDVQITQEFGQQSKEKKGDEKKEGQKEDGNGEQKIENKEPGNMSKIAHANGEGSEADRKVEDDVKAKTAGNGQNSEEEPNVTFNVQDKDGKTQKTVIDNTGESKEDDESGYGKGTTGSTTDAKDETPKPQQSGGNEVCLSSTRDTIELKI